MKGDIKRNMEFVSFRVITLVSFLKIRITNKYTMCGTGIKFMTQDFGYVNIYSTTEGSGFQVWLMGYIKKSLKFLVWGLETNSAGRNSINKINSRFDSLSPIELGHIHSKERCTYHLHDMSIFPLCKPILLRCVSVRSMMPDSLLWKIITKQVLKKFHGIV